MNASRTSAPDSRQQAAADLIRCYETLATRNENLLQHIVGDSVFECWRKYPSADAIDSHSGFQYFYHAHSADDRPGTLENGHFHTFARFDRHSHDVEDWDASACACNDAAPGTWDRDSAHLIAISVNALGLPVELFTVNRWVTGDRWCSGASLSRLVTRFDVRQTGPRIVARWLNACIALYETEIQALLIERDAAVQLALAERGPGPRVTEDRSLEVLSARTLSFSDDVEAALRGAAHRPSIGSFRPASRAVCCASS
ncbi:hypothetical protein [Paraburkholderia sp.]|uniref:DUF6969 family protein n=1 Tax=Paraburkholderia sp. TaxID=1926495 RepID=UPI0025F26A7F|nr:hypothetical protein [Paraburkholderia sp.]